MRRIASRSVMTFRRLGTIRTVKPSPQRDVLASSVMNDRSCNIHRPLFEEPIYILGAGAVGMLLAGSIRFTFPSYPLKLLLRDKPEYRNVSSISISMQQTYQQKQTNPRIVHIPCESISASLPYSRRVVKFQNVVITTKAFDAVSAVESILDRVSEHPRIILLCNGALAVSQEIQDLFQKRQLPRPELHMGVTTHGVFREIPRATKFDCSNDDDTDFLQQIVHAGYGDCVLERPNYNNTSAIETMANLWDMAGWNCSTQASSDIQILLWKKLAANCVINPLTALYGCRNGELRQTVPAFEEHYYPGILQEVAQVYIAVSTKTMPLSVDEVTTQFKEYTDRVIVKTANNRSSMLQDVTRDGLRKTEIDYLSGFVVVTGHLHGLSCFINEELWKKVRLLAPS